MIWDLIGRWMINHVSKFGDLVCDGIDKLLARDLYPRLGEIQWFLGFQGPPTPADYVVSIKDGP